MVKDIKKSTSSKKPQSKKTNHTKHNAKKIKIVKESTSKRKWNEKNENGEKRVYKKGSITPEESLKIERALCEYAFNHNYSEEKLLSIITEKLNNDNKIWPEISECLPERSVQSVHNFCHRKYHPNNYKGYWTAQEEQDLINLVKEHGKKWVLIASKLDRTPINVKDKYKQLGEENNNIRTNDVTLIKILKLLKAINKYLNDNENFDKYNFMKYTYKFSNNIENDINSINNVFKLNKEENKFLIDSCLKEDTSNIIIKNTLKKILDIDKLSSLIEDKIEISWNVISKTLGFYSVDTCRNVFKKILNLFNIESISSKKKDLLLINRILDLDYENIDEINWDYIKARRKPMENKERMEELIKNFDPFGIKNFKDVLIKIKNELENELNINNNNNDGNDNVSSDNNDNDEEKEFKEEIKQRNKNNIIKIYKQFKRQKGFE